MRTGRKTLTLGLLASGLIALGMFACSSDDSGGPKRNKGGSQNAGDDTGEEERGGSNNRGGSNVQSSTDDGEGGTSSSKGGSDDEGEGGSSAKGGSANKGGSSSKGGASNKGGSVNKGGTSEPDTTEEAGGSSKPASSTTKTGKPYSGSEAADSRICNNGLCNEGASSGGDGGTGTWSGYGYSYSFADCPDTTTMTPPCGTGGVCYESSAKKLCVNGSIPADYNCGIGIGINLAGTSTVKITKDFKITVAGLPANGRVGIATSSGKEWCVTAPTGIASGATIGLADLVTNCYEGGDPQTPYDNSAVKSVQVYVPGDEKAAQDVDFCIVDLQP